MAIRATLAGRTESRRSGLFAGICLSALLVSSGYVSAEQARRGGVDVAGSEVQAALAALEAYNQALVERSYSRLKDELLHTPFVVVDETPRVITDVDAVVAGLRKTRESLDAADYATTQIERSRVSISSGDRLLLNCRLRHLKKDGSLLSERATFYVMVKVTDGWKVGGIVPQDPALFER